MAKNLPFRIVFVIVAALGIDSATFAASAAQQAGESERSAAPPATLERAGLVVASVPTVAKFYALPNGDAASAQVSFVQNGDVLTAIWTSQGKPYGRGTYRWDATAGSFRGTSTTRHLCLEDNHFPNATVLVREELYVVNDHELRDRWTKPLSVDCSLGLLEVFRWTEDVWLAADKEGKPLPPRQEPLETLVTR